MVKLKAKVVISKDPCNCKGFYHPGDVFEATNAKAQEYLAKKLVEVVEEPAQEEKAEAIAEAKAEPAAPRRTKN